MSGAAEIRNGYGCMPNAHTGAGLEIGGFRRESFVRVRGAHVDSHALPSLGAAKASKRVAEAIPKEETK